MKRECGFCAKVIEVGKDKFILLGTYNGKKVLEEKHYHIECFKLWFETSVRNKAKIIVDGMQKRIMPMAKKMIQQVMGG